MAAPYSAGRSWGADVAHEAYGVLQAQPMHLLAHLLVAPALRAGDHQARPRVAARPQLAQCAHQSGYVLARLQRAQKQEELGRQLQARQNFSYSGRASGDHAWRGSQGNDPNTRRVHAGDAPPGAQAAVAF